MLCAHLFKSGSRAELAVWDWQQKLFWHPHRVADLEYQHLLRSLSVLTSIKDEIERKLFLHLGELFDYTVDLVFYDLTSSYVEGVADWSEIVGTWLLSGPPWGLQANRDRAGGDEAGVSGDVSRI